MLLKYFFLNSEQMLKQFILECTLEYFIDKIYFYFTDFNLI